jgi:hypothetical protein
MEKFSKYLTREKAEFTKTGLPNTIPDELLPNIIWLGINLIDPAMDHFNFPDLSWIEIIYRSPKVNELAGSTKSSWHGIAAAMDPKPSRYFKTPTNSELFYFFARNCKFDRLLWELGGLYQPQWIHIQGKPGPLRQQIGIHYMGRIPEYKYWTDIQMFEQFKALIYKK